MKEIVRLDEMAPGECATVYALQHVGGIRRRLRDIGLVEETKIECVGKSPLGDPGAYLIRGAVIAIRRQDAKDILVFKEVRGG